MRTAVGRPRARCNHLLHQTGPALRPFVDFLLSSRPGRCAESFDGRGALVDPIIRALEVVLLPELERRRVLLSEDARFDETKVVSLRHADVVHTIGLTCHPVSAATAEESYSVHVNIIGLSGIGLRGFACWDQPFIIDRLPGYTIYEAMTRPFRLESLNRLDEFLALLPALFSGFERGIRRGWPPSALRQLWNRIVYGA